MFYCSPLPASVCQLVTTEVQQQVGRVQEKQCRVSQLETLQQNREHYRMNLQITKELTD